jgi:hypothetical protein
LLSPRHYGKIYSDKAKGEGRMINKSKNPITKTAFLILLLHIVYIVLFAFFMLMATLLEIPCNRSGIYEFFITVVIAMIVGYPLIATLINTVSVVFQIGALRNNESKAKNIVMMIVTVLYEIAIIIFFAYFWQGAMGV